MRRLIWGVLGLLLTPGWAGAATCGGRDLMAELARSDPASHAAMLAAARAEPNAQGKFWRVRGGGGADSYLFGTYHDTELGARPIDPGIAAALEGARVMLVELTEAEQARLDARAASDPAFVFDTTGGALVSRALAGLDGAARAAAEAALAGRGLDLATADMLRPWMLFSLMGLPYCQIEAIGGGAPVLDTVLMRRAGAAGVPVRGLESYEQALAAFDAMPPDLAPGVLADMIGGVAIEEDMRATLTALYDQGEIAAIGEVGLWLGRGLPADADRAARLRGVSDRFGALLIGARNRAWVPQLVAELRGGGVFAAFGALHLPGEDGIVALLQAEGFTVERLD